MKIFVSSIILLALLQNTYSQMITELNSGVTTELNSSSNTKIDLFNYGWACGVNGVVIKSTTSSGQWINVSGNGIPANVTLDNICGLDGLVALVAGHLNSNTWVWKTTNGGQNWYQVFTQPNGRINAVWMKNYVQGFMQGNPVGGRWSLWKTTNGGNNWDSSALFLPQASNELGWPNSFCMPNPLYPQSDSNKIWFGTNNYRIYYSSNYGQSWSIQALPLEQNIVSLAYGPILLYAGGSNNLFKSTNYGLNWAIDTVGGTGAITGITYTCFNFYLTRGNKVYRRESFGWFSPYTAPSGNYKYLDNRGCTNFYNHYGVRSNGGITLITDGLEVKKIYSEIPNGFSLSQNYPNPFNPITKIKFAIPLLRGVSEGRGVLVRLVIYDILGREITTLVNEQLQPGTYEVEWDGSNYPSGVYFYKLITHDYIETKKMVLVK